MAESNEVSYEGPTRTVPEPQRLRFVPSEGLREILSPFYRPTAQSVLAKASLWSTAYLAAERTSGANLVYDDPSDPNRNSAHLITRFNRLDDTSPLKHPLPLLSYVRYEMLNQRNRLRINLRLGTIAADEERFALIPGFAQQLTHGYVETFLDIKASDFVPSRAFGRAAINSFNSVLGVDHPARGRTPEARRFVDPDDYYAIREPNFRYSSSADPKWTPRLVRPPVEVE